jgi:hypothetical protein
MKDFKLPDFDDMILLTDRVGELSTNASILKARKDELLASITKHVVATAELWEGSKPPAMNFISAVYHQVGYNEETRLAIWNLNQDIAHAIGNLEKSKMLFQVYRDMIDVWKANEYNRREATA